MPKTIEELIKEIDKKGHFEIICINSLRGGSVRINTDLPYWEEFAKKKWYSEEEVDKIIEQCMSTKIHMDNFQKTGIIKCPICAKKFIKTSTYTFKPDCDCFKQDLRLCML